MPNSSDINSEFATLQRVAEKLSTSSHNLLRYSLSVQWLAHGIFIAHKIIRSHRGVSSCKTMSVKVKVSRASGPTSQVMLRPSKQYTITTTTTQEKLQEIHPVFEQIPRHWQFGFQQKNLITTFDVYHIFAEEPPLQLLEEISLSQNDRHNQLQAPWRTGWSGNDSPQVMAWWNSFIVNGVNKNPCYPNTSQVDSG